MRRMGKLCVYYEESYAVYRVFITKIMQIHHTHEGLLR